MSEQRPHSPAAERNQAPVLRVLQRLLGGNAEVLEIGAGTGQHADGFTAAEPGWRWSPTDRPAELATLQAGLEGVDRPNLAAPAALDVLEEWPRRRYDAVYSANTAHIMPIPAVQALFRGAAGVLSDKGHLVLYGPFHRDGRPTADSNARFDATLRARDPGMGVRDLADIDRWAEAAGLERVAEFGMPANNLILVFVPDTARRRLET